MLVLFAASPAAAFCPTRTCQRAIQQCDIRGQDCVIAGHALFRSSNCVTFNVQAEGSPRLGLDAAGLERLVSDAFRRWTTVDCGDGAHPSIYAESLGPAECHEVQCNCTQGNANIFMVNDTWTIPGAANAYALTTVFFSWSTGEIRDADVEINGSVDDLQWADSAQGVDLPSILTHEVGHFLGLGHSPDDPAAVMRLRYSPGQDLRELTADDVAGICSIYPPGRATTDVCAPANGFAGDCGPGDCGNCAYEVDTPSGCCSTAPGHSGEEAGASTLAAGVLLAAAGARRWRARVRAPQ